MSQDASDMRTLFLMEKRYVLMPQEQSGTPVFQMLFKLNIF